MMGLLAAGLSDVWRRADGFLCGFFLKRSRDGEGKRRPVWGGSRDRL